ncbi:MAG TPA: inorganic phosphate transporter [Candidatus Polarisedimenticolaceae bacterium]|nr:inorganic phosphate transporter [Candidatus Polarisedimenticolaceae bacterium]
MTFILVIILVALVFDFLNGFHDAANSIATVVSTRVLSPRNAVAMAAFFNFVAAFGFEPKVAATIGKGVVHPDVVDPTVILCGLIGASVWDLLTWWWGLPTSSSHALIGGLAGAAVVKGGLSSLVLGGLGKIAAFIVLSPTIGMVLGFLTMTAVIWISKDASPRGVDRVFRRLQLASAAAYSFGHGLNDAQKTMGIIAILLVSAQGVMPPGSFLHMPEFAIPLWLILTCHAAIALGTLFGGWRIVKTMGMRVTKLRPVGGFCAETAGAITLFGASAAGIPVSTTHTITGAIVGVGSTQRASAVRWGVAGRIVWAWIFTIPAAGTIAAVSYLLAR